MALQIRGLSALRERLERLRVEEVMARALAAQAEQVADAVRHNLSDPPGGPGHDQPWLQSGALRDSVGAEADGLQAVVGSSDPAAVPQEMGTHKMAARPFLAPIASSMGEDIARAIGAKVAAALRGETDNEFPPTQAAFAGAISSGLHTAPPLAAPARTAPRPKRGIILAGDIASDLEALGGGMPRLVPTKKGATQFIFPNGMILRFDLQPGQYLDGQVPHINLEFGGTNLHVPLK